MDPTLVARGLAGNRMLIGAGLTLAPQRAARRWIGPHSDSEGAQLMARAVGARDVGLALGTLATLRRRSQRGPWLQAAALADGIDFAATLAAARSLPRGAAAFGLAMSGVSTVAGVWLVKRLG